MIRGKPREQMPHDEIGVVALDRVPGGGIEMELVPAAQRESRRLMIVLHGLGDSMEGYRGLPQMLRSPWLNYLLVNAPDEYYGGYSWFDFAGDPAPGVGPSSLMT